MPQKHEYHPSAFTQKLNAVRKRSLKKLSRSPLGGVGSLILAIWLIFVFWLLVMR